MTQTPRVFISYSHDSPEHKEHVLELSERLRADGIDAMIDQYIEITGPPEGWPRWMEEQLRTADFVLLICTPTYLKRVEGREEPDKGHGVLWESTLVYQYIYDAGSKNERFVPVLLGDAKAEDIPMSLRGVPNYRPTDQEAYEGLYRRLTGQPRVEKGQLGSLRPLPSRKIEPMPLEEAAQQKQDAPAPTVAFNESAQQRQLPLTAILIAVAALLLASAAWYLLRSPSEYRVHVAVLDPAGKAIDQAEVTSSAGGEVLRSGSGWQLVIGSASRPANGALTIRAAVPAAFLKGETEVRLGRAGAISATVALQAEKSVGVRGIVVDSAQRAIAGVRVSVVGQTESAVTKDDGTFALPAHAAAGQQVQLRAEKSGFPVVTQWHPAGDAPATVVIE